MIKTLTRIEASLQKSALEGGFTNENASPMALAEDLQQIIDTLKESDLFIKCPECGGNMHEVPNMGTESEEIYLHCDNCDVSMDSDGGYTK